VEQALIGKPWSQATLDAVHEAWGQDFKPLSDMRASAAYRLTTARNMALRALFEDQGQQTSVLEVTP
jgi:xanthine dehydrogenase small subunit